jgi:hypothetical protein
METLFAINQRAGPLLDFMYLRRQMANEGNPIKELYLGRLVGAGTQTDILSALIEHQSRRKITQRNLDLHGPSDHA